MTSSHSFEPPSTTTCPHCGAALPPTDPRFCIDCGGPLGTGAVAAEPARAPSSAGAATVRLPNARVTQSVVGGTVKLPTAGAIPPGLWFRDDLPGPDEVLAVYAPLRAIVGGWSGLIGAEWQPGPKPLRVRGQTGATYHFDTVRTWFPSTSSACRQHLHVHIRAQADADEGHTRRGFHYRTNYDPPMEVIEAWWADPRTGRRHDAPVPRIQLMAPPRVPRISDYDEQIRVLPAEDARSYALEGRIHEIGHLLNERQQRTPAGRGLVLGLARSAPLLKRMFGPQRKQFYVQAANPFVCRWPDWVAMQPRIQAEAQEFGLAMGTDAVVEWWLDRKEYDSVLFEGVQEQYEYGRVVIAFRRSQIIKIAGQ